MDDFGSSLISFLAILNPFALCLYLEGVMSELEGREFARVLVIAAGMSWATFSLFAWIGEPLMIDVLGVDPEALQIFGGVIITILAYHFVSRGYRAMVIMSGQLEELPSAIAVPFMVGAGTLMQSIIIGKAHNTLVAIFIILLSMSISVLVVLIYRYVREKVRRSREQVFDRYINILARMNGLLVGAIGTHMIVTGVHEIWFSPNV